MANKRKKPGPEAERVKIPSNWQEAVKGALQKRKPAGGWPKPEPKQTEKE